MKNSRDGVGIRAWMFKHKIYFAHIRRDLGLRDAKQIRLTLTGERNHRKTLRWLRDNGCPEHLLDLPDDIKDEQVAA